MFHVAKKKRRVAAVGGANKIPRRKNRPIIVSPTVLHDLVICLTGLPVNQKNRLHRIVEFLGGSFTGDLDTSKTTHLIAQAAEGEKYEMALKASHMFIVTPIWLTDSFKAGKRMNEVDYVVPQPNKTDIGNSDQPLLQLLEHTLSSHAGRNVLFAPCKFFLIGFDIDSQEVLKLEKLIQRGRGTIYKDLNETINYLIVKDECHRTLIEAAKIISARHPCEPPLLSPRWVIQSFNETKLLSSDEPGYQPRVPKLVKEIISREKLTGKERKVTHPPKKLSLALFKGAIFCIVRLLPPPRAVNFSLGELTNEIIERNGQILSKKVVEALQVDNGKEATSRRTCYVVCWGGFTIKNLATHHLLSQIQSEDLCELVLVSPIWLKTAIKDRKIPAINRTPILFESQPWPFLKLPDGLKIAVTGFVGSERTALVQTICAIGGEYTESMKPSNTHLICRDAKGAKYLKGLEWGLYVVSIKWLYHVVQYGYEGQLKGAGGGCEDKFLIEKKSASSTPTKEEKIDKLNAHKYE